MLKKTAALSFLLALITVFSSINVVAAESDADVCARMEHIHDQALSKYRANTGSGSFHGNCGIYMCYLLNVLGIDNYMGGHNGNQWYGSFDNGQTLLNGYTAVKFAGRNCLYDLTKRYGEVSNIIVSFPHQTGYSYQYPGAGHCLFIHLIRNGKVYFTESYGMYGVREGKSHIMTIDSLMSMFEGWYGSPIGAVWFAKVTPPTTTKAPETTAVTTTKPLPVYTVDVENGIIGRIPAKATVADVKKKFAEASPEITDQNGAPLSDDVIVSTGMIAQLTQGEDETVYYLAVLGDIDGNGSVTSSDARLVLRKAAGVENERFIPLVVSAADMNNDGKVNSFDARELLRSAAKICK